MSRGGVVLLAASQLGLRCGEGLLDGGVPIVRIVSIPREFQISWSKGALKNAQFADLSEFARRHSISHAYMRSGRTEDYRAALDRVSADLVLVAGWYYHIPDAIRATARFGAVGIHTSLLPKYRGGAPLVWAIINGEEETGVSLFHLASGTDDGDVIAQARLPIARSDDIAAVIERATEHSVRLVRNNIALILAGAAPRTPQDERLATVMPQRTPEDGLIHWEELTDRQAHDWIRAQSAPYAGAFTFLDGARVTIWEARPAESRGRAKAPGTVEVGDGLTVWCAGGTRIDVIEVSVDGHERMSAKELIARHAVRGGARFGRALECT